MEDDNPNFWAHLRRFKFRTVRLHDSDDEPLEISVDGDLPFITVPDFSTRFPHDFSITAAFEFLRHLPPISASTLPEDRRACDICYEPYTSGKHPEVPCRLPCQHILGRSCIGEWILPGTGSPNTTCPICRSELFTEDGFIVPLLYPSEEGDIADWMRETTLAYQGDPNAEERMEVLARELQRVGSTSSHWPTEETIDYMRMVLSERGGMTQRRERGLAERSSIVEPSVRDGGDHLSAADRGVLNDFRNLGLHESFIR